MLVQMPLGDAGTEYTLKLMAAIAHGASRAPIIQNVAHALTQQLPDTAVAKIGAVRRYLASYVTFQNDPPGIEYVQQPTRLAQEIAENGVTYGDCDDVATLGASLGLALGLRARYIVVGFRPWPVPFAHVYLELSGDGVSWEVLDTTKPRGGPPVAVVRKATYPI